MKNYSYIGISLIILIFGIIFIPRIIDRISKDDVVTSDRLSSQNKVKTNKKEDNSPLSYIVLDGEKKKAPSFKFINQDGNTITNADYNGKVYLVEFFFTTCPSICPIMTKNLVEIEKEFSGNSDFGIASFSIDPTHDSPEVLKEYAENHGIKDPDWNLMTGKKEDIYELANKEFGIYAGEDSSIPGGFAHQGMFALVDKEGFIRSRKDEFGNPVIFYKGSVARNKSVAETDGEPQIDELIQDIKKLL